MSKHGIILIGDHRLFRSGLKYLLETDEHYHVTGEASDGKGLLDLLEKGNPDLVIMEVSIHTSDGIEYVRKALSQHPALKILILAMCGEPPIYNSFMDSGIKGFLLKDSDYDEFFHAVSRILSGSTYFSQAMLMNIIKEKSSAPVKLSSREKEVLTLISKGLSNHEIAASLRLSQRTIERHRTNMLNKTGSRNSIRLVIYALKNNLISEE